MSTIDTTGDRKHQDAMEAMLQDLSARGRSGLMRRRGGALLWVPVLRRIAACISRSIR